MFNNVNPNNKFFNENGSITIEAAFVVFVILTVLVGWMFMIQQVKIQAISSNVIDQMILEISDHETLVTMLEDKKEYAEEYFLNEKIQEHLATIENVISASSIWQEISHNISLVVDLYKTFNRNDPVTNIYLEQLFNLYLQESSADRDIRNYFTNRSWYLDTTNSMLTLRLYYELERPNIFKFFGNMPVLQTASAGRWQYSDAYVFGKNDSKEENIESSIWHKSPFERGRFFANQERENASSNAIKPGKGFDIFSPPNSLTSIYSVNIFSASYSSGDEKNWSSYDLNEDSLEKLFNQYANKMLDSVVNYDSIELQSGEIIPVAENYQLQLRLIMPSEASNFREELNLIKERIETEKGVTIQFEFDQPYFINTNEGG